MASTKKTKHPTKPRIPSEIIAVESILKTGRIRFRCTWQVYDFGSPGERNPRWELIRTKIFKFSAGSMEELLAAVHGAVLTAANTNGVRLEAGWRKFCPRCGRLMTVTTEHECPDIDEHVAMMNTARLAKVSGRRRLIKTLDKEKIDDTVNATEEIQRETSDR